MARAGRRRAAADGAADAVDDVLILRRLVQRRPAGGELLLGARNACEHPSPRRSGQLTDGRAAAVTAAESAEKL